MLFCDQGINERKKSGIIYQEKSAIHICITRINYQVKSAFNIHIQELALTLRGRVLSTFTLQARGERTPRVGTQLFSSFSTAGPSSMENMLSLVFDDWANTT